MTPAEIQFELAKRNMTQSDIATQVGVSKGAISRVIRGGKNSLSSERIKRAIANAIDLRVDDVFISQAA